MQQPVEDIIAFDKQIEPERDVVKYAKADLDKLSCLVRGYCPGEIPELGEMLNILAELISKTKAVFPESFLDVTIACKLYIETMVIEDIHDMGPVEEGVVLLKAILRHLQKGSIFGFDTSDVIEKLAPPDSLDPDENSPCYQSPGHQDEVSKPDELEIISEQDIEILIDFVSEAQESLESIEVSLIELEQNPSNMEILNNIFRPFHTIKGVSGFLCLDKINLLSHATENLLDSARSGEFLINDIATDVILESVDTLKLLISRVKQGLANGIRQKDDDIDITGLKNKLQSLQNSLINGDKEPIGEILIKKGVIDRNALKESLQSQKKNPEKKLGEILIREKKAEAKDVAEALRDQKKKSLSVERQVKVSTSKLDDLVDYAGELVIAQSIVKQKASKDSSLNQSVGHLGQIVSKMQNIAMSMRMIPIKSTFMKMIRLIRDLSHKSGKEVSLDMIGEETEIDRNVVDALYEPMMHMIRNSVDHGIEPAKTRLETGKPAQGKITLRAYHKGGNIIIEIEDDGKGLDKEQIIKKGISTGLISKDDELSDKQIYNLILEPGFSTAKKITDISGRGVGMDVVKNGIEKFRGSLGISSEKGIGTKFTISLPLTMAIIDGMLVRVGKENYVIPTIAVKRIFRPDKDACFTVEGKGEMIKQETGLTPLIRLKRLFGMEKDTLPPWESLVVVVESEEGQRGLIIDELIGKDEYVIKSLGESLENVSCFAGGAILSDGRVGLILDIDGVFQQSLV
ncbi:MAG: chemotaxis protein CheA [Desulfobacteraceae bacterium]|nr:chemotaxis protein CheA [Desulfobacteraceae bacterium]